MSPLELGPLAFASPWFLALLALPLLLPLLRGKTGPAPAIRIPGFTFSRLPAKTPRPLAGGFAAALPHAALALFAIALARPQYGQSIIRTHSSGIDILLALDVSQSMLSEDFTLGGQRANRVEAIRKVTQDFIKGRPNDRIGILAFAGRPYLVSPLTLDHDWLLKNMERVKIGLVEDGTAIGSALASAANRLRNREAKSRLIVLLTDGDNNAGEIDPKTAAEAAKALGIRIYAIGAGSHAPAPFPVGKHPLTGRLIYRNVEFKFDEERLKEIADVGSGKYFRASDTESLEKVYEQIDKLEKTTVEVEKKRDYKDWFQYPLAAGVALLLIGLTLTATRARTAP